MNAATGAAEADQDAPGSVPMSVVQVRVGTKSYPMYSRPSCRTCQSRYRYDIEHKILSGYSMAAIADWVAAQGTAAPAGDDDPVPPDRLDPPTANSLRSHAKKHMPMTAAVTRDLIDARAQEISQGLADGAEAAADHITLARLLVQRGMEGLADGTLAPEMTDVMSAAKFLAVHDVRDDGADVAVWRETLMAYMEVARTFIPEVAWKPFGEALSAHPVLRALVAGPTLQLQAHREDTP